jgi:hypothetical protein
MVRLRPAIATRLGDVHYSTAELASARIPGLYLKTLVSFTFSVGSGGIGICFAAFPQPSLHLCQRT